MTPPCEMNFATLTSNSGGDPGAVVAIGLRSYHCLVSPFLNFCRFPTLYFFQNSSFIASKIPSCRTTTTGDMSEAGVPYTSLYSLRQNSARKSPAPSLKAGESNTARYFPFTLSTHDISHVWRSEE